MIDNYANKRLSPLSLFICARLILAIAIRKEHFSGSNLCSKTELIEKLRQERKKRLSFNKATLLRV